MQTDIHNNTGTVHADKICRENQNTFCVQKIFFSKIVPFLDNVEKYGRAKEANNEHTIWHMHIECWIMKTTNTHSEYVILTAFLLQQCFHERASMLRHTYIATWGKTSEQTAGRHSDRRLTQETASAACK